MRKTGLDLVLPGDGEHHEDGSHQRGHSVVSEGTGPSAVESEVPGERKPVVCLVELDDPLRDVHDVDDANDLEQARAHQHDCGSPALVRSRRLEPDHHEDRHVERGSVVEQVPVQPKEEQVHEPCHPPVHRGPTQHEPPECGRHQEAHAQYDDGRRLALEEDGMRPQVQDS